jgi:hypothetical protein
VYDLREGWARYRVVPVPVECFVIDDAFSFAFQNLENCALGAARRTTTFSPGRSAPSPFTLKRPYRFSGLNLLTASSPALAALQQATRTVPIVFVNVIDPVGSGFVDSLTRPSGNTTGFLLFECSLSGKWLELLKLNRAKRDGSPSKYRQSFRERSVRRHPDLGAIARDRGEPDQHARRQRDRARRGGGDSCSASTAA